MTARFPPFSQVCEEDNTLRKNSLPGSYAQLKPAFDKRHGTVTAANSTPLTDGAAAVLMMTETRARELGLTPLGFLRSYAFTGNAVQEDMLLGPSYAAPLALARAGLSLSDLTLIDMHEAFAAQVLTNLHCFASEDFAREKLNRTSAIGEVDPARFNVLGGSIAYGHPFCGYRCPDGYTDTAGAAAAGRRFCNDHGLCGGRTRRGDDLGNRIRRETDDDTT